MKKNIEVVHKHASSGGGAVYAMGLVGSLFYFLSSMNSFSDFFWGVIKSVLWPAFLVYRALGALNM